MVEVAEGFSGKLQMLQDEMISQFNEVGKQIRFLSDQIGDNRTRLMAARSDLAAGMVRLNEALGATRVQIRQDIAGFEELKGAVGRIAANPSVSLPAEISAEIGHRLEEAQRKFSEELEKRGAELQREGARRIAASSTQGAGAAAAAGAESVAAEVRNEVKATHKALTSLAKKFDRFDNKISVQVKDQDQRLRKLERQARG